MLLIFSLTSSKGWSCVMWNSKSNSWQCPGLKHTPLRWMCIVHGLDIPRTSGVEKRGFQPGSLALRPILDTVFCSSEVAHSTCCDWANWMVIPLGCGGERGLPPVMDVVTIESLKIPSSIICEPRFWLVWLGGCCSWSGDWAQTYFCLPCDSWSPKDVTQCRIDTQITRSRLQQRRHNHACSPSKIETAVKLAPVLRHVIAAPIKHRFVILLNREFASPLRFSKCVILRSGSRKRQVRYRLIDISYVVSGIETPLRSPMTQNPLSER